MIAADASLAVKWYADEDQSEEAENWLAANAGSIIVPDIFVSEVIGSLVRHANIAKSLRHEAEASIRRFEVLFEEQWIKAERMKPSQIARASAIALDLGHPLKDCIYLALAMERACDLVTCDARFVEKASLFWPKVKLLS